MSLDKLTLIDEQTINYINRPFRNLFINGDMNIHQRGITATGITTTGYYTADRMRIGITNAGTWSNTIIENDAPTNTVHRKSMRVTCTTTTPIASSSIMSIQQRFEGQHLQILKKGTSASESITISFWVKSNVIGTYICNLQDDTNGREISTSYTINATATWERKIITFTGDTVGTLNNDSNLSLSLVFWLMAGSNFTSGVLNTEWGNFISQNRAVGQTNLGSNINNYFQITGIQMETGINANPFEFLPYEIQMMRCQRYYYRITPGVTAGIFCNGYANSTMVAEGLIKFPFTMRAIPTTVETTSTNSDYQVRFLQSSANCSLLPVISSISTTEGAYMQFTVASGLTAGHGVALRATNTTAYLGWNVEL